MPALTIRFIYAFDRLTIRKPMSYLSALVTILIAWWTNSLWIHCEALSRDGKSWTGAHAGTGVQARPLDWIKPIRERTYAIPVPQKAFNAAHDRLESQIGMPYDYLGILGLAIHRRIHNKKARDCSNLMTDFMQHGGLEPLNTLSGYDYLITPETLHLSSLFIGKCIYKSD
jgi:hypothetical protein